MRLCDSDNFEVLFDYALTFKDANLFNRDGTVWWPWMTIFVWLNNNKALYYQNRETMDYRKRIIGTDNCGLPATLSLIV